MKEPKKQLYNDVWFFYKKWLNNTGSDEEWEKINAEADSIIHKYDMDPFARSLLSAVIVELGRS